jgi:hypothetical protein
MIDPSLSSGTTTMPRTGQSPRSQTIAECDSRPPLSVTVRLRVLAARPSVLACALKKF